MKLKPWQVWAIQQSLGDKRGKRVVELLSGPVGALIDLALAGRVSEALAQLDTTVDAIRKVLSA